MWFSTRTTEWPTIAEIPHILVESLLNVDGNPSAIPTNAPMKTYPLPTLNPAGSSPAYTNPRFRWRRTPAVKQRSKTAMQIDATNSNGVTAAPV
jgi:hypothetical protein